MEIEFNSDKNQIILGLESIGEINELEPLLSHADKRKLEHEAELGLHGIEMRLIIGVEVARRILPELGITTIINSPVFQAQPDLLA